MSEGNRQVRNEQQACPSNKNIQFIFGMAGGACLKAAEGDYRTCMALAKIYSLTSMGELYSHGLGAFLHYESDQRDCKHGYNRDYKSW